MVLWEKDIIRSLSYFTYHKRVSRLDEYMKLPGKNNRKEIKMNDKWM